MRKLLLLSVILINAPWISYAQYQPNRDLFPNYGNYEKKGWMINPELTYMLRPLKNARERLWVGSDTVYDVAYRAEGKISIGLEFARFYAIENSRLISYVDFAIGGKILRGVERFEATLDDPDRSTPYIRKGEGAFSQSWLTASFNATNSMLLSRKMFLNNTLGINADYRFAEAYQYNDRKIPNGLNYPSQFIFQAHYSIGLGFKISPKVMMIPSVETPVLTFYEYEDLKSTLGIFNSRYRPLIFRLTFMVLDNKPDRKCPKKVKSRQKTSLFGDARGRPW